MAGQDLFNIVILLATAALWAIRWKKTKSYQIYAFNEVRKGYFGLFAIVVVIFIIYFNFIFSFSTSPDSNFTGVTFFADGEEVKSIEKRDISEEQEFDVTFTYTESIPYLYEDINGDKKDDFGQPYTAENGEYITPKVVKNADPITGEVTTEQPESYYGDPNGPYLNDQGEPYTKKTGKPIEDLEKSKEYELEPVSSTVHVVVVDKLAPKEKLPKFEKSDFKYNANSYEPTVTQAYSTIYVEKSDVPINYRTIANTAEFKVQPMTDLSGSSLAYAIQTRDAAVVGFPFAVIPTSLLLASMFYHFVFFSKAIVKAYLDELYNINKFCGFLSYNMSYRANARVLVEDTLSSIDDGQFKEDFALIFFEKDRSMQEKIADICNIYTFKFLEMFLGIASIVFIEGPSDSTTKSLQIIQGLGDEYFIQADLFFRTKASSMSQLQMIIIISALIPAMVKVNIGYMFVDYVNTGAGFMVTNGFYVLIMLIFVLVNNMYINNKIIRKEGRYV